MNLLLELALGRGLVDDMLEDRWPLLARRWRARVIGVGVTGVGLLEDGHACVLWNPRDELLGDGSEEGYYGVASEHVGRAT